LEINKAFVLNSIDYKESSKILYLYSEKGHLSVIAHGVKKMNSINRFLSQNGTLIKLSTTNGKFPSLKEGEIINEYENIKKSVESYTYMNHIMELVRNVISEDLDHIKMFHFLEKVFIKINNEDDYEIITFIFELKLLHFIGYGLNFKECSICGKSENLVFNVSNGGLVCPEHLNFNDLSYNIDIYNYLKYLYYIDLDEHELPKIANPERVIIRNIIDMLFDEFVSFKTKSRNIIKQIKKY
jgi:DNA repair protein RecO (recombination protein O)